MGGVGLGWESLPHYGLGLRARARQGPEDCWPGAGSREEGTPLCRGCELRPAGPALLLVGRHRIRGLGFRHLQSGAVTGEHGQA